MKTSTAILCVFFVAIFSFMACQKVSTNLPNAPNVNETTPHKNRLSVKVGGKTGYIDRTGKLVINPQYDMAFDFADGLAAVCVGNCDNDHIMGYRYTKDFQTEPVEQTFKYGYINEEGQMVINPTFESARSFAEGLAAVCVGHGCYYNYLPENKKPEEEQKWGFIDKTGKLVIIPQFKGVNDFHEGLAAVTVGDKTGFIDKTGKFVINPQYDGAYQFDDGVASVSVKVPGITVGYKYGFIDKQGNYIWQPSN